LENFILKESPPKDTLTTCLKVLLVRPGTGGILPGSTSWGAVLQVPTQACLKWDVWGFKTEQENNNRQEAASTVHLFRKEGLSLKEAVLFIRLLFSQISVQ
jgi:hypothetical protein